MKLENPWIGYLDRSYRQVKSSIINRLKTATPEITDYSESNLLIIIVSIFSGIAEQLNFYIDNWAREGFLSTARRFSSVVKHTKLLDYRIKSYLPASVDLFVTYVDLNGDPVVITEQAVIPAGTVVRTANSVAFISQKTVLVEPGQSFGIIPTKQWERVEDVALGTTTNQGNQEYYIPGKYAHNTLELYVDGDPWLLQTTLARSLPTDKHFIINVGEDAVPYVQFGNGVKGKIPPANKPITADYNTTDGQSGNTISEGTITELDSVLVLPNPSVGVSIVNELKPIGGADIEDIEDIRTNAPLTIRTLDRAVTRQDFKDMVIQADGVAKANVVYNCGIDVEIYISPNGGGVADNTLLNDTKAYIEGVKIINRRIIMKGAGVTPVVIIAEVTPRFRVDRFRYGSVP